MKTANISRVTIADIQAAPNIDALMEEYAAESGLPELGRGRAQWDVYHAMECTGLLHVFAATVNDELVGFISVIVMRRPHYDDLIGNVESYFVASAHRKVGAGIALLHAAEDFAKEKGAVGVLLSAPVGSRLDRLMIALKWEHSHNTYLRGFA